MNWPRSLALNLTLWYAWAPLALLAIAFAHHFPIRRTNWWHRLPLALAVALLLALTKILPDYPIIRAMVCPTPELLTLPMFDFFCPREMFQQASGGKNREPALAPALDLTDVSAG